MTALAEKILSDLVTYSSFRSPLSSHYFEGKYNVRGVAIRKAINEIIESNSPIIVCSDSQGYYAAANAEESAVGLKQISARVKALQERLSRMEEKHNRKFSKDPQYKRGDTLRIGVDPAHSISSAFAEKLAEDIERMTSRSGIEI